LNSKKGYCPRCHSLAPQYELPQRRLAPMVDSALTWSAFSKHWTYSAWVCGACFCPYLVFVPEGLSDVEWSHLSGIPVRRLADDTTERSNS
jgi:hypothetical protein